MHIHTPRTRPLCAGSSLPATAQCTRRRSSARTATAPPSATCLEIRSEPPRCVEPRAEPRRLRLLLLNSAEAVGGACWHDGRLMAGGRSTRPCFAPWAWWQRGPDSGPARDTTPARSARLKSGPQGQRLVSTLPRLYPLPLALLKNAWVPAYLVYKLYTPVAHVRGGSPAYEGPMKDSAKMTTRAPGVAWCLHQRRTTSRIYLQKNSSAQFRLVSVPDSSDLA